MSLDPKLNALAILTKSYLADGRRPTLSLSFKNRSGGCQAGGR